MASCNLWSSRQNWTFKRHQIHTANPYNRRLWLVLFLFCQENTVRHSGNIVDLFVVPKLIIRNLKPTNKRDTTKGLVHYWKKLPHNQYTRTRTKTHRHTHILLLIRIRTPSSKFQWSVGYHHLTWWLNEKWPLKIWWQKYSLIKTVISKIVIYASWKENKPV